jgi:hypothetical protein
MNPLIYSVNESKNLQQEICNFLNQLKNEEGVDHLITMMTKLKSDLDKSLTESKMRDASNEYNEAKCQFIQFLEQKTVHRKILEKSITDSLTSKAEDDLIVGMSGNRMPWFCGD